MGQSLQCIGRSNFRPPGRRKCVPPGRSLAHTGPGRVPLKFHIIQVIRTFRPSEPSVLEACILWRRSGLKLNRPPHIAKQPENDTFLTLELVKLW
jgi:hypothetical protein